MTKSDAHGQGCDCKKCEEALSSKIINAFSKSPAQIFTELTGKYWHKVKENDYEKSV